jgi:cyclic 2,3-diphosphoglycerate synthetase
MKRALFVVDGEHSATGIGRAIDKLASDGFFAVGLYFLGGSEKSDPESLEAAGLAPVFGPPPTASTKDLACSLSKAIAETAAEAVYDLSDEPVATPAVREILASIAAWKRAAYFGPGYRIDPPFFESSPDLPTVAVIGTGKRTGKTAVCIELARNFVSLGARPLIVTMGRGGPADPVFVPGGAIDQNPRTLLAMAEDGLHAASDYVEDALFTGLPSIGAWRCGGGLLGQAGPNAVRKALDLAKQKASELGCDLLIFEGSGASIPPVSAHSTVLAVPFDGICRLVTENAASDSPTSTDLPTPQRLGGTPLGGFGYYKLLLADAVVATGAPESLRPEIDLAVVDLLEGASEGIAATVTSYRMEATEDLSGKRVVLAVTAPERYLSNMCSALSESTGAEVVDATAALSRPKELAAHLDVALRRCDVLVSELKGRAVELAARKALELGKQVAFLRNVPVAHEGLPSLCNVARLLLDKASERLLASKSERDAAESKRM